MGPGFISNKKVSRKTPRHPLMHRTRSLDFAIVLSGEIYLVLDDSETLLEEGDTVIQCGTNHAWSNRLEAMPDGIRHAWRRMAVRAAGWHMIDSL